MADLDMHHMHATLSLAVVGRGQAMNLKPDIFALQALPEANCQPDFSMKQSDSVSLVRL